MSARAAPRTMRVAAVQVESRNGRTQENLARAERLVAEAAARGAKLVLCPEFLAAGYVYDNSIWRSGEPRGGPTERMLTRAAREHDVYVGATYLEADGDDFWNTFALAAPGGAIAGRVRKESLPAFEGWYFKSCSLPKTLDTPLGRIAVGICQDNHTARFLRHVAEEAPDLILMPHSAPCATLATKLMREVLSEAGPFYATEAGVPVVLVNKACTKSRSPIPGLPGVRVSFTFPGLSSITDSDGRMLQQLADREGVAVADVTLDPARKRTPRVPSGYWSRRPRQMSRFAGALLVMMERLGARAYANSSARARAARAVRG